MRNSPRIFLRADPAGDAKFGLADARLMVARAHAFESWPKFKKHIEEVSRKSSPVSKFESAADAVITGDITNLKRLLRENPELIGQRSDARRTSPRYFITCQPTE